MSDGARGRRRWAAVLALGLIGVVGSLLWLVVSDGPDPSRGMDAADTTTSTEREAAPFHVGVDATSGRNLVDEGADPGGDDAPPLGVDELEPPGADHGSVLPPAPQIATPGVASPTPWPPPRRARTSAQVGQARGATRRISDETPPSLLVRVSSATTGGPIPRASVRLENAAHVVHDQRGNGDGDIQLHRLDPGHWRFRVDADHHVPFYGRVELKKGRETVLDVALELGVILETESLVSGTPEGIGDVQVTVHDRDAWLASTPVGPPAPVIVAGESDANGVARLDALPRLRDLVVVARSPGFATVTRAVRTGFDDRSMLRVAMHMVPGASLDGLVLRPGAAEVPLRGAHVLAVRHPLRRHFAGFGHPRPIEDVELLNVLHHAHLGARQVEDAGLAATRVRTDAEGRFRIEGLVQGDLYSLIAFSPSGLPSYREPPRKAGGAGSARLRLRPAAQVQFKGLDSGRPVRRLLVELPWPVQARQLRVDRPDFTRPIRVASGPLVVHGSTPLHPQSTYAVWVAEERDNFDRLLLADGASIAGRVHDMDHRPLAFVSVDVAGRRVSTDRGGDFSLAAREGHEYRIRVDAPGYRPYARTVTAPDDLVSIRLRPVGTVTATLVLPPRSAPPAWSVVLAPKHVIGSDGSSVQHQLRWQDGARRVEGLDAGRTTIYVTAPGFGIAEVPVEVVAGEEIDIGDIELPEAFPFHCQVVDALGHSVEGAVVDVSMLPESPLTPRFQGVTDSAGRVDTVLPRPEVRIRARAHRRPTAETRANLARTGPTHTLTVILEDTVELRGQVLSERDRPVAKAQIRVYTTSGPRVALAVRADELGKFSVLVPDRPCLIHAKPRGGSDSEGQVEVERPSKVSDRIEIVVGR